MNTNILSASQLQHIKWFILAVGLFFAFGGAFALLRSVLWVTEVQVGWLIASGLVLLVGVVLLALAADKINMRDSYFSMTPELIKYKLTPLDGERELYWEQITDVRITDSLIEFKLVSSQRVVFRFDTIAQPEKARHVARSLRLAAIEKKIPVNGVVPDLFTIRSVA